MRRTILAAVLALAGIAATCPTPPSEIDAERAIAIARTHVTFEPAAVNTARTTANGRAVWRVNFRGKPMSADHPLLYPTVIVFVDRRTGEIVSVAKT